jgi:magnesium chelatase family protein
VKSLLLITECYFLDELPEFNSSVIEALRQPIETREVLIARSGTHIKYPANFQLIAAMNPCKCGYLNDAFKACPKAPSCGSSYQAKISGPMLDRFDLHIEVGGEETYNYDIAHDVGIRRIFSYGCS